MALDFFGTLLLGHVSVQGKKFDLFPPKGNAAIYSQENAGGVAPFLQEMTIEMGMGLNASVSIVLTPPLLDAIALLNSALCEKGAELSVNWGYVDGSNMYGMGRDGWLKVMATQPTVSFGMDTTIVLNGVGYGFAIGRESTDKVWENVSPEEVIGEIADKYKLGVNIVFNAALQTKWKSVPQQGFSDLLFMRFLGMECGCEVWIQGEVINVAPLMKLLDKPPPRTLVYLAGADKKTIRGDIGNGVYPMLTFDVQTTSLWLPGSSRGIVAGDIDPKTKLDWDLKADVSKTATTLGDVQPNTPKQVAAGTGPDGKPVPPSDHVPVSTEAAGKIVPGQARNDNVGAVHQGEVDRSALYNLEASCDCLGIPFALPGEIVKVRTGVKRFDGAYIVWKVTHVIGVSGYVTKFELKRSGYSAVAGLGVNFSKANGPYTQQAKDQPETTKTVVPTPGRG